MHNWGDDNVDWEGISKAAYYIGHICIRYGRIRITDMKEKYGTVRVYASFGWHSLFSVYRPHYYFTTKYNRWMDKVPMGWMNWFVLPYQSVIYRLAYKKALKKWPHLRDEILDDADYPEYLKGL